MMQTTNSYMMDFIRKWGLVGSTDSICYTLFRIY